MTPLNDPDDPDDLGGTGLTLTADSAAPGTLALRLTGALDHESADALVREVARRLAERPAPRLLRLDCAGLTACDSLGLSALLMIGRRTGAAACALRLDRRPPHLDRLLEITGTHGYLVGPEGEPGPA
ncbi:STAS domain-containing protein [Streptomyces albidoflavus]|uniref:STAS domain-containing protein n=1 Tax=Streptomyces albidoflavus TaxID=1886 RepID=UPI00101E2E41|nr:STAS domain-containing protein [Streptomyces albidoflavus]RZD86824.1 anti-sigma factor antagonist [Streptomyces albidoflavus]